MNIRLPIAALALSASGFVSLLVYEGYTDKAVIPIKGDVPTIGFGTTGGVSIGDRTDPVSAVQRAARDVVQFEGAIKSCVKVPLAQAEYDVYTEHAYNIGGKAFCGSTITKRLNAGDYRGACDAILMWRYAAGKDCSKRESGCLGLWKRRLLSYQKCEAAQ